MTDELKISASIDVHALADLQAKALWVLDNITDDNEDRFSAITISDYLIEKCGFNTSRQAITFALKRDKKICNKNRDGYKLMEYGRKKLLEQTRNNVIFIESGKPFSAKNIALKEVFSGFVGTVKICDPFVDIYTLDIIFKNIDKKSPVSILTANVIDRPNGTFRRHLEELKQEGFKIEVKIYKESTLHDRYMMDDKSFWLSGNSLNHLGKKESFLILLGSDIYQSMNSVFSNRWKVALPI
ncbi:MAG: hypothetical protein Q7U04_14975 [Bacteriovorax sp.]|nr:hypothetical protein [Bacteriovorax sp.]